MKGKRRLHHPSQERVRELLTFDSETGVFRARVKRSNVKVGDVVGCPNAKGYLRTQIDGELWYLHDIAWLIVYGRWPTVDLDHKDTNRANNAIDNLREGSRSQNNANWKKPKTNTSGFKGVSWIERLGKWRAMIMVKKRNIYLGLYDTPEEASDAYMEAASHYFGDFARGS